MLKNGMMQVFYVYDNRMHLNHNEQLLVTKNIKFHLQVSNCLLSYNGRTTL